jgi:hypothetical protein
MDPAFPDVVGEWAEDQIDDRAKVWTLSRGIDGRLEDRLDPTFLETLEKAESVEELAQAIAAFAARREIEASRVW